MSEALEELTELLKQVPESAKCPTCGTTNLGVGVRAVLLYPSEVSGMAATASCDSNLYGYEDCVIEEENDVVLFCGNCKSGFPVPEGVDVTWTTGA
jgi:hypothetical protein